MEVVRSVSFCNGTWPHREQMNGITAFVDASNVYGSDNEKAMSLRTVVGDGKLLESDGAKLPLIDGEYTAGDIRARENPGLTALHTVFVREHNRIAAQLKTLDDSLSNEELYQRARRLVGAQYQNVVYTEYLPTVLGEEAMTTYNLKLDAPSDYNPNADPSITNVFATAAYRFGHSQIQDLVQMIHDVQSSYQLSGHFFNSTFYDQYMDAILEGMITQKAKAADVNVAEDVTEKLFANVGPGSDLIARNIQRGRDHGLPGYNEWREKCFGAASRVCSWEDPPSNIPRPLWDKLYKLYDSPSDIDLFSAGLAEDKVMGGHVGATFACIIGKQFEALKDGDRFFFNHKEISSPPELRMHQGGGGGKEGGGSEGGCEGGGKGGCKDGGDGGGKGGEGRGKGGEGEGGEGGCEGGGKGGCEVGGKGGGKGDEGRGKGGGEGGCEGGCEGGGEGGGKGGGKGHKGHKSRKGGKGGKGGKGSKGGGGGKGGKGGGGGGGPPPLRHPFPFTTVQECILPNLDPYPNISVVSM
jgi:hypothetical protein